MIELITKFHSYQKLRFPLLILIISLVPVILSSAAVVGTKISLLSAAVALLISLCYFLHIRIGDEERDYEHDNLHHKERPIQKGLISLEDLKRIDYFVTALYILLLGFFGLEAFIFGLFLLGFTYVAKKEFFLGTKLRGYFFLYNFVNLIQTALLQVLIYALFAGQTSINYLIILHFTFTFFGTLIFEFIRKIYIPGTDGTGKDTYTWYIPFEKAIFCYIILVLVDLLIFLKIAALLTLNQSLWFFIALVLFVNLLGFALLNATKKTEQFNQFMRLSFGITYSGLNLAIYLLKFY